MSTTKCEKLFFFTCTEYYAVVVSLSSLEHVLTVELQVYFLPLTNTVYVVHGIAVMVWFNNTFHFVDETNSQTLAENCETVHIIEWFQFAYSSTSFMARMQNRL